MTNTIRLQDIVKEWNDYRSEAQENMFYQFEHGNMNALKESTETYKNAIDMYTKVYCFSVYMRNKQ